MPVYGEVRQFFPVDKDDGEDGTGLNPDVEEFRSGIVHKFLDDQEVSCGRDGHKFCDAFNKAQDNGH